MILIWQKKPVFFITGFLLIFNNMITLAQVGVPATVDSILMNPSMYNSTDIDKLSQSERYWLIQKYVLLDKKNQLTDNLNGLAVYSSTLAYPIICKEYEEMHAAGNSDFNIGPTQLQLLDVKIRLDKFLKYLHSDVWAIGIRVFPSLSLDSKTIVPILSLAQAEGDKGLEDLSYVYLSQNRYDTDITANLNFDDARIKVNDFRTRVKTKHKYYRWARFYSKADINKLIRAYVSDPADYPRFYLGIEIGSIDEARGKELNKNYDFLRAAPYNFTQADFYGYTILLSIYSETDTGFVNECDSTLPRQNADLQGPWTKLVLEIGKPCPPYCSSLIY